MMEVSGVRISWEMERRRFERIRSFSASARSASHFFILVVRAEVKRDTISSVRKVSGYPSMVKLKARKGEVKAKFTQITPSTAERMP